MFSTQDWGKSKDVHSLYAYLTFARGSSLWNNAGKKLNASRLKGRSKTVFIQDDMIENPNESTKTNKSNQWVQ